jgi:hypothetical protein
MWAAFYAAQPAPRKDKTMHKDWIRRSHRWIAGLFLITVAANFAAMTQGQPPAWITYAPLLPLFILMATGSWMLAKPHLANWQARRAMRV